MNLDKLKQIIKILPNKPGVYQYYNSEGVILYVGKAKNLKKEFPLILQKIKMAKLLFW